METVPYVFLRCLELEGRHPHDGGGWHTTVRRIEAGEGVPSPNDPAAFIEIAPGEAFPPAPRLPRSARVHLHFYRRIRSALECERFLRVYQLEVPVSLRLFAGWANPPDGVIPMPSEDDSPLRETHLVALTSCRPEGRQFAFQNTWGGDWGRSGSGCISYEYFDKFVFESWVTYPPHDCEFLKSIPAQSRVHRRWLLHDEWDRRVYGFDIWDKMEHDRLAWAFVLETDNGLEIEELYVRPEFRSQGLGHSLATNVRALANAKVCPLRLWVPFVDCKAESPSNYPALIATARVLGVGFQRCPVKWAAYYASDEKPGDTIPIEPRNIPARPKATLEAVLALATSVGSPSSPLNPTAASEAVAAQPDAEFPAVGTPAWKVMNRRRAELINKRHDERLTPDEEQEYQRLQRLSQAALQRAFPAPPEFIERVDRLEAELRSSEGEPVA